MSLQTHCVWPEPPTQELLSDSAGAPGRRGTSLSPSLCVSPELPRELGTQLPRIPHVKLASQCPSRVSVPSLPQTRPLSRANRTAHISTHPVQVSYHLLRSREAGEGWAAVLMKCGVWGGGWERGGTPRSRSSCSRDAGTSPKGPLGDADGRSVQSAGTLWLELRDRETQVLRNTFPSARPCRPHTGSLLPSGASAQPTAAC